MNYIIIAVVMILVFIMIFTAFASDDREDEIGYLSNEEIADKDEENGEEGDGEDRDSIDSLKSEIEPDKVVEKVVRPLPELQTQVEEQQKNLTQEPSSQIFSQLMEEDEEEFEEQAIGARPVKIHSINRTSEQEVAVLEAGSEDDLRLRMSLKQNIAKAVSLEKVDVVAAVIQLRFSDDTLSSPDFVKILSHAESVFDKNFSFEFETYQTSQLNRVWIFRHGEDRDVIIESLIVAYEATMRFRKALEADQILKDAKVRIGIGLSAGSLSFISRGVNAEPTIYGRALYLAETLSEIVGDFGIYVDSAIHAASLPLFDFREWKPVVVRQTLSAIPLFELLGWNKADEIASYVKHEESSARKSVATAYRYFDIEDTRPLVELLSDKDQAVVLEAASTISFIGNDKMNGVLKLKLSESNNPDIRSKIIEALGNAGNTSVVPLIFASTKENSWKVRLAASKALYRLSGKAALDHIKLMLEDPDSSVRVSTNSIFYKETGKKEYLDEIVNLLRDESKRARAAAVDCLISLGNDFALKEILNVFSSQERDLQMHILSKMIGSKSKILYQCYLTLFKNSSEELRPHIVEAVRRAGIVS